jgi:serine/threonine-protein kinase HipA
MTDYRSVENLQIVCDDEHVANLRRMPKGYEFHYTNDFLNSSRLPIALHLPKTPDGLKAEGLANVPTYFAGLLPEGVMLTAVKRLIGTTADDLFAVLAASGADAIGDVEVRIPGEKPREPIISLAEAADQIRSLLAGEAGFTIDHVAAIPGLQPKISLGQLTRMSRSAKFFAKFDSPECPNLISNEYACMRLAHRCGLNAAATTLHPSALVTRRFDRIYDPAAKRLRKAHLEDMLQVMDLFPNSKYSMEYIDLMKAMDDLGVSRATLLDALELYVFSYIIGNGDLHAKNVSLVLDKEDRQWRLSPAYDLLSTLPYQAILPEADRMALALADESYGHFTVEEFVEFGKQFRLPAPAVSGMVVRLAGRVLKHLQTTVQSYLPTPVVEIIEARARSLSGP